MKLNWNFWSSGRGFKPNLQGGLDIFWTVTHIKSSPDNNFVACQVNTQAVMLIFIPHIIYLLFIRTCIDKASGDLIMIRGLTLLYHL